MPITSEALSSNKRVYVVTVTYGNRIQYLREVINAAFASGAFKIIVVDNGSSQESRRAFKDIINESNGMVRFILFPVNKGSAVGFSKGIKIATNQSDCEFVWLLDDDNTPDSNALAALIQSYDDIKFRYNHSFLCLISLFLIRDNSGITKVQIVPNVYWVPRLSLVRDFSAYYRFS